MQTSINKRLRAEGGALPAGELPLFKWASKLTFAVDKHARRYGFSIPRLIAERAGLPAEPPCA
jgi:hypothetical protein